MRTLKIFLVFLLAVMIRPAFGSVADTVKRLTANPEMSPEAVGAPVVPFQDTLFYIYTGIGPATPADRAKMVAEKIRKVYRSEYLVADSMQIHEAGNITLITYRETVIIAVTDEEAEVAGKTRRILAMHYESLIIEAIAAEIDHNSLRNEFIRAGIVLAILAGVVLLLFLLSWLFRRLRGYLTRHRERITRRFYIGQYELVSENRALAFILWVTTVIKYFIFLVIIYTSLPFIFLVFPVTKGWAHELVSWVVRPVNGILHSVVGFLPNLITIIVIVIVFVYLNRLIRYFAQEIEAEKLVLPHFHADWAKPTYNIIRVFTFAFMFVVIFPYLPGSGSPVFQGVTVFLGVLISFGSSSAINNLISGIVITYMRPYKVGDRIRIGDSVGDVIEKNLLVTRIRTIKNEDITIPNSQVMSGHTLNFSSEAQTIGLILHTSVTIGYDSPWRKIHELLIAAAEATEGLKKKPKPFVLQRSLDDFYIAYEINAFCDRPNEQVQIYSDLHQNIQDKFNEAGMEIMSPHYAAVRDGNTIAIPEENRSDGYEPPAFRIKN
jgi:small-conductance mechanosensitive channel